MSTEEQSAYLILRPELAKALAEFLALQMRVSGAMRAEFPEIGTAIDKAREPVGEVQAELAAAMDRAGIETPERGDRDGTD